MFELMIKKSIMWNYQGKGNSNSSSYASVSQNNCIFELEAISVFLENGIDNHDGKEPGNHHQNVQNKQLVISVFISVL